MAAQELGGLDPGKVVFDGTFALRGVGMAQRSFAVDHDQENLDVVVGRALLEVAQVLAIAGLILEELVHQFDRADAVVLPGRARKIEMIQLLREELLVEGPFRERNVVKRFSFGSVLAAGAATDQGHRPHGRQAEEIASGILQVGQFIHRV